MKFSTNIMLPPFNSNNKNTIITTDAILIRMTCIHPSESAVPLLGQCLSDFLVDTTNESAPRRKIDFPCNEPPSLAVTRPAMVQHNCGDDSEQISWRKTRGQISPVNDVAGLIATDNVSVIPVVPRTSRAKCCMRSHSFREPPVSTLLPSRTVRSDGLRCLCD